MTQRLRWCSGQSVRLESGRWFPVGSYKDLNIVVVAALFGGDSITTDVLVSWEDYQQNWLFTTEPPWCDLDKIESGVKYKTSCD